MKTSDTNEAHFFKYHFNLKNGTSFIFEVNLDPVSLVYLRESTPEDLEWTRIDHSICDNCPLVAEGHSHCPVAVNLTDLVKRFGDTVSYEQTDVSIETNEREYVRHDVAVQQGLSSILGIIMVSSGCPDLDYLRPMVRSHLPFATIGETMYRATSMYLLAQYTRQRNGMEPDWSMEGLTKIYQRIDHINRKMVKRLQSATAQDASLNAVVILDTFAQMVPMTVEGTLKDLEHLFWPYLRNP